MKKPRIRISKLTGLYVCFGSRCTGSGETARIAWHAWEIEMILAGNRRQDPGLRAKR